MTAPDARLALADDPVTILRGWAKAYRDNPQHRFPSDLNAEFFPVDLEAAANEIAALRASQPGTVSREAIKADDDRPIPTYGQIPWKQLGRDVHDAIYARREDWDFGDGYPGHKMLPTLNFNSLARIVDKYRYCGLSLSIPANGREATGMREALETAREEIVLTISFLGRDAGTDRLPHTVDGLISRLVTADKKCRAALSALPVKEEIKPLPGELAFIQVLWKALNPIANYTPVSRIQPVMIARDAIKEANALKFESQPIKSAIAAVTADDGENSEQSYVEMLWKWFEKRRGKEDMRANMIEGLSADDFEQMLDEHEAELLSAAPPSPDREAGWQPIETAPKDVDVLLGWWRTWPVDNSWECAAGLAGSTKGGWLHGQATHWRPLPAPPNNAGEGGK